MTRSKTPRKPNRPVQIFNSRGHLIAVRNAPTLKQALLEWASDQGHKEPKVTGNHLSVMAGDQVQTYIAREAK